MNRASGRKDAIARASRAPCMSPEVSPAFIHMTGFWDMIITVANIVQVLAQAQSMAYLFAFGLAKEKQACRDTG
jgi:hypothetical protein